jgi:hypothetical protein
MSGQFIYFIRPVGEAGPVKIGCSTRPLSRLDQLMTWSPIPLEIAATCPGDYKLEARIHNALADCHSHREWFLSDGRISMAIRLLNAGKPIDQALDLDDVRGNVRAKFYRHRSEVTAIKRGKACALPPFSPSEKEDAA